MINKRLNRSFVQPLSLITAYRPEFLVRLPFVSSKQTRTSVGGGAMQRAAVRGKQRLQAFPCSASIITRRESRVPMLPSIPQNAVTSSDASYAMRR
jgi:hypothetical protein